MQLRKTTQRQETHENAPWLSEGTACGGQRSRVKNELSRETSVLLQVSAFKLNVGSWNGRVLVFETEKWRYFIKFVSYFLPSWFLKSDISYPCWLHQLLTRWLFRFCDPSCFLHWVRWVIHWGRWWGGHLLTDTPRSWRPASLSAVYPSPEWLGRGCEAVIAGEVEVFPRSDWEGGLVSVFLIDVSMFYFWEITSSSWRKKKIQDPGWMTKSPVLSSPP